MKESITNIEIDMRVLSVLLQFTSRVTQKDIMQCINYGDMEFKSETIQGALEILDTQGRKAFDEFYKNKMK